MSNLPRDKLMAHADAALKKLGGKAVVHFKYTCELCGERVLFDEPNVLYEEGECCSCGHVQPVTEGGYLLEFSP